MKVLLGRKKHMTQIFREDGTVVPVTMIEVGPCTVTSVRKNPAGKTAAVIGFGSKKSVNKAQREEWKDLGTFAFVSEFVLDEGQNLEKGQVIGADLLSAGENVNVVGTSKGKGYQGVVRRHGFKGSPKTHGHKDQLRKSGSIGAGGVQRVFKGLRMAGRMGGDQVTVKNLEVVHVDSEKNLVAIKGAVPGAIGGFVKLMTSEGNVWQK